MYHVHHGKASNQRLGSKPLIKQRGKQPLGRGSHGQGSKAKTSFLLSLFQLLSCVRLFVILWIVAHQALLPTGFSRQEHWSGLPCHPQGIFQTQGLNPHLLYCRQILYH